VHRLRPRSGGKASFEIVESFWYSADASNQGSC